MRFLVPLALLACLSGFLLPALLKKKRAKESLSWVAVWLLGPVSIFLITIVAIDWASWHVFWYKTNFQPPYHRWYALIPFGLTTALWIGSRLLGAKVAVFTIYPFLFFMTCALPGAKINDMRPKSWEGATKARLGMLRAAIALYHDDHNDRYPDSLETLTRGARYLESIPETVVFPHHRPRSRVVTLDALPWRSSKLRGAAADTGDWAYVNDPKSPDFGTIFVSCTHTDTKEVVWTSY